MIKTTLVCFPRQGLPRVCRANELIDEGVGFSFKKWQADNVMKNMDSKEVEQFIGDKDAGKQAVKKYGDGTGDAPKKDLST